jgi:hypothetical protein
VKVSHGACGKSWEQSGNATSHCGGCHETFVSLSTFDAHRRGQRCNPPAEVKVAGTFLEQREDGQWYSPGAVAGARERFRKKDSSALTPEVRESPHPEV